MCRTKHREAALLGFQCVLWKIDFFVLCSVYYEVGSVLHVGGSVCHVVFSAQIADVDIYCVI